jgi:hypothetical protein
MMMEKHHNKEKRILYMKATLRNLTADTFFVLFSFAPAMMEWIKASIHP